MKTLEGGVMSPGLVNGWRVCVEGGTCQPVHRTDSAHRTLPDLPYLPLHVAVYLYSFFKKILFIYFRDRR